MQDNKPHKSALGGQKFYNVHCSIQTSILTVTSEKQGPPPKFAVHLVLEKLYIKADKDRVSRHPARAPAALLVWSRCWLLRDRISHESSSVDLLCG